MKMKHLLGVLICTPLLLASCKEQQQESTAAQLEQESQNLQMQQFLKNQPIPSFDWSLERHVAIQLYIARQKATNTWSVVQSPLTGKVLWQCASIGYPIPYATQLTNPLQAVGKDSCGGQCAVAMTSIAQQEPNGLFSPSSAEGTWVMCVDENG